MCERERERERQGREREREGERESVCVRKTGMCEIQIEWNKK